MEIKAINTFYNGNYFRSRLEAKWAVFFDLLGVSYEYEKEGYDLHYAGKYLPDFFLPQYDIYIEIKPNGVAVEDAEKKISELSMFSGRAAWLIMGTPYDHDCKTYINGRLHYLYGWICFVKPHENDDNKYEVVPDDNRDVYESIDELTLSVDRVTPKDYGHYAQAAEAMKYRFEHIKFHNETQVTPH